MHGKFWKEEDIQFVKDNIQKLSIDEIANKLGRTKRSIKSVCTNNKLYDHLKPKIGDKFNKLTIDDIYLVKKYTQNNNMAKCSCECGNTKDIKLTDVVKGHTQSCGCVKNEKARIRASTLNLTHKLSNHRLYRIWAAMKTRCENRNVKQYKNYGGRGIKVCEEWKDNFINFYNWSITHGYDNELSLDRIDFNGNYVPENCRWLTQKEQNNNKSVNIFITAWGETKTLEQWSQDSRSRVQPASILYRIEKGYDPEDAISTPRYKKYKQKSGTLVTAFGETKTLAEWGKDNRCKTNYCNISYRISKGYAPEYAISTPYIKSESNKIPLKEQNRDRLYTILKGIKSRCYNKNSINYIRYGAKGIGICDEWKNDPEKFYSWAKENGYQNGLTIHRKINNIGYNPENCEWVSIKYQNNHKSNNINITAFGETKTITQWLEDERCLVKHNKTITYRLNNGYTTEEAITKPTKKNAEID